MSELWSGWILNNRKGSRIGNQSLPYLDSIHWSQLIQIRFDSIPIVIVMRVTNYVHDHNFGIGDVVASQS